MNKRAYILLFGLLGCLGAQSLAGKKVIATGFDQPTTSMLRKNLELMEHRPFDGVVIDVETNASIRPGFRLRRAFSRDPWKQEWFQDSLNDLKACKFKRFTDNFAIIGANPGDVDWFDDQGWAQIVDHFRIAARFAKEAGLKGLIFDPEPYTEPYSPFTFKKELHLDRYGFEQYRNKIRERGAQMMKAMAAEYPDITILCFYLVHHAVADPKNSMATTGLGMLPALLDGWLDEAPSTVTIVDGCEDGYRFNSEENYKQAAGRFRNVGATLISSKNLSKFNSQVHIAFPIYLDAFRPDPNPVWAMKTVGGRSITAQFDYNLNTALRYTNKYVWLYGERYQWWPSGNKAVRAQSWPEVLPGCDAAIRRALGR